MAKNGRKAAAKLERRRKAFDDWLASASRLDISGRKRPGSLQRR